MTLRATSARPMVRRHSFRDPKSDYLPLTTAIKRVEKWKKAEANRLDSNTFQSPAQSNAMIHGRQYYTCNVMWFGLGSSESVDERLRGTFRTKGPKVIRYRKFGRHSKRPWLSQTHAVNVWSARVVNDAKSSSLQLVRHFITSFPPDCANVRRIILLPVYKT